MAMKQVRGSKMNAVQREYLIDFMCTNQNFAAGRFVGPMGHESSHKTWAMLMHDLNTKGPDKTIEQWKKVWADIKSKARAKVGEIRAEHNRTGNVARDGDAPLTESEKKVIAIIGGASVEGLRGVADSLPDSVESLRKLIDGDQSGLSDENGEFSIAAMCAEPVGNNDSRRGIEAEAGPSRVGQPAAGAGGPSSRPSSTAVNRGNLRQERDSRVIELLEEQNDIMKVIASNGGRLNALLEEIVGIKRRKLALLEAAQSK